MALPTLTTYGGRLVDLGYQGQDVDMNDGLMETKSNDVAVDIDFGFAVARSAANDTCQAPTNIAHLVIGIALRHAIRPASADGQNTVLYRRFDAVPIKTLGYIYALAAETTVRGDGVIARTATNGSLGSTTGGAAGAGRIALNGASGNVKAVWETTTTAGQIGIVKVG